MAQRILIGTGTGRCGTTSLAALLDSQAHASVTHERLKYHLRADPLSRSLARDTLRAMLRSQHFVEGDVALQWIWYVPQLVAWAENVGVDLRVLVMQRNREDVIRSYQHHVPNYNHWQRHDGEQWDRNAWDQAFPVYPGAESREDAIGRFWDDVHQQAWDLADTFPDTVMVAPLDALNQEAGQRDLLRFAGFTDPVLRIPIHKNRGRYR